MRPIMALSKHLLPVQIGAFLVLVSMTAHCDIQDAVNSVCLLEVLGEKGQVVAKGSAVVCSSNGMAVTCYHVIAGAESVRARLHDGRVIPVKGYQYADKNKDFFE